MYRHIQKKYTSDQKQCGSQPRSRDSTLESAFNLNTFLSCMFLSKDTGLRSVVSHRGVSARGTHRSRRLRFLACFGLYKTSFLKAVVSNPLPQHIKLRKHVVRDGTQPSPNGGEQSATIVGGNCLLHIVTRIHCDARRASYKFSRIHVAFYDALEGYVANSAGRTALCGRKRH